MIAIFATVLVLHIVAGIYHLYWSIYEFDSAVHFLGGASLSLFFLWLYFFSEYFHPRDRSISKFLLVSVLGAMFVGVSWEIYELIFKQTMVQKADYDYDLMIDLTMDLLGAVTSSFYAYIREYNKEMIIKNQK